MSANKINIPKPQAIEKIEKQIAKGSILAKRGIDFVKNTPNHSMYRNDVDKFKVELEQWVDITQSIIFEIFESYKYGGDFKKHTASRKEYVSSSWQPDIKFYLEFELLPKLEYLKILRSNIEDLDEVEPKNAESKVENLDNDSKEVKSEAISKISVENYDFSKITIPRLLEILTIPQLIKIISSIFALLVISFWIGYYFHSFQSNEKVLDEIKSLSKEIQILKDKNDSLSIEFQKINRDSIKIK